MKKVFLVLGLLVVFLLGSSMKTGEPQDCWINIGVSWDDDCSVSYLYKYQVSLQIFDLCSAQAPELRFTGNDMNVLPPQMTKNFCVEETLCTDDEIEKCWKVVATVRKVNAGTNEVICDGQTILLLNCKELLGLNNVEIGVPLN